MPRTPSTQTTRPKGYSVVLSFGTTTFKAKGATIAAALGNLKPTVIKGKGIFTVSFGNTSKAIAMYPPEIRRLMINQLSRELFQKRIGFFLA